MLSQGGDPCFPEKGLVDPNAWEIVDVVECGLQSFQISEMLHKTHSDSLRHNWNAHELSHKYIVCLCSSLSFASMGRTKSSGRDDGSWAFLQLLDEV